MKRDAVAADLYRVLRKLSDAGTLHPHVDMTSSSVNDLSKRRSRQCSLPTPAS
jgi:hypothetical protein